MSLVIRDGMQDDAAVIADLLVIAGDGIMEFVFDDVVPGQDTSDVLAYLVADDDNAFSCRNCLVAEDDGKICGVINYYPHDENLLTEEEKEYLAPDKVAYLEHFFAYELPESICINALAVQPDCQGRGIGSKLISEAQAVAKRRGFHALSMFVWADNHDAIRLYERLGFKLIDEIFAPQDELLGHPTGTIVMACDI